MKINSIKQIESFLRKLMWIGFCLVAFISCKDDDVEGEYLYIQDELYFLNFQQSGGEQAFELYSNLRGWKIQNLYSSDDEWLDIWPNEGNEDGRFSIKVSENENASSRVGIINVVVNGQVYKTVTVNQVGSNPYIELDMGGISSVTVPAPGTSLNVKLNTNVLWEVEIPAEMSSWISLGNTDVEEAELIVARNSDWDYRSGEITFRMIGTGNEAVYVILSIQQRGLRSDISSATEVTIAELLRSLSAEGGQISENVYVWANVISNKNTLNVDETAISYETEAGVTTATIVDKLMWVQDASGKGILVEFTDASDHVYNLNDRLQIHMVDQTFIRDESTGRLKLAGLASDDIITVELGSGIQPIEITDLSEIGNYENTLVTLKNVEFAIPMGTYVNINEDSYNEEGNATSINLGDTPREYAHILRDKAGNFVRLYSASTFTDRFKGLIPQGSGDITGIVMKKNKNGEIINTLRIRNHADNNVSNSVKDRLTNTIVQFGPFDDVSDKSTVTANIGTGTIKTSMFSNILNTSGSTAMYWAWTYARRITADLDANGNASPALTTNIQEQYACLNTQQWWNGTGTSILDQSGEAWIITFSTEDAQGDLLLSFTTSSSQTGPRYFTIEWADSENTAAANWQAITEYESTDWNSNYQLLQHQYRLPDAIKGKQSVVIRMRVNQNVRVNGNTSTIASGGTNRIGYWSVTEKKY